MRASLAPSAASASAVPPHLAQDVGGTSSPQLFHSSPMRPMGSPRRRVRLGGARKGVAFAAAAATPRKKSPRKRAVRWRDDDEEGGKPLVEFQVTPKALESSPPEIGSEEQQVPEAAGSSSSPVASMSAPSSEARKAGTGRFAAGFLAKKGEGGTGSPMPPPPSLSLGAFSSEGGDNDSPLREMAPNSAPKPRAHRDRASHSADTDVTSDPAAAKENTDDAASSTASGSDTERSFTAHGSNKIDKQTAGALRSAMKLKRSSSINNHSHNPSSSRHSTTHHHRRRSPTASTARDSPPPADQAAGSGNGNGNSIFSASHARRMVKSEREEALRSVLSPRTQPVVKQAGPVPLLVSARRQTTAMAPPPLPQAEGPAKERDGGGGVHVHKRVSSVVPGSATRVSSKMEIRKTAFGGSLGGAGKPPASEPQYAGLHERAPFRMGGRLGQVFILSLSWCISTNAATAAFPTIPYRCVVTTLNTTPRGHVNRAS
ncbi:tubulin-dependent ATPase kip3 [Teratosphaeriaceae sp. CCFEE 6253]|nr:tubulin-dependent ATPase kip3 [Teratosphaeriaceae sp. CCFEE 6253]